MMRPVEPNSLMVKNTLSQLGHSSSLSPAQLRITLYTSTFCQYMPSNQCFISGVMG